MVNLKQEEVSNFQSVRNANLAKLSAFFMNNPLLKLHNLQYD